MKKKPALLIVDLQNDYCPGGALQVPNGDRVIKPINRAVDFFAAAGLPILASRDCHQIFSKHFREHGGAWPVHCVYGTKGADFHPALHLPEKTIVLTKGMNPERHGYSAFEATTDNGSMLADLLRMLKVPRLYIAGLATEYCVLCTTMDALRSGFEATVLTDAVAGVDIVPGASDCAIEDMENAGAQLTTVEELLSKSSRGDLP